MEQKRKKFKIGEQLRIISNENKFKILQENCRGYSKLRMYHLPGSCVVVKHFTNNEVLVEKNSVEYYLNPNSFELNISEEHCLFNAISNENEDNILKLVENANLNIQDKSGKTPIHLACSLGKLNIVKLLLNFKPDLEIPDNEGNLPIHTCIIKQHYEILHFLIDFFPKILKSKTSDGKSIQDLALCTNDPKIFDYLATIQHNSDSPYQTLQYSSEKPVQIENSLFQEKPEELICQICTVNMIKRILQCGHVLCKSCFQKVLYCPFDREEITFSTELYFNE